MKDRVLVVCGIPRSGSSLTMQALFAGGYPCVGEGPAFEDDRFSCPDGVRKNAASCSGRAVKILDIHRNKVPMAVLADFILLVRDPVQQAFSNAKFLSTVAGIRFTRKDAAKLAASIPPDIATAKRLIESRRDARLLTLRFEDTLANPLATMEQINLFVGGGLDVAAMAAVVLPRGPECQPDMSIEMSLIEASEATA